MIRFAQTTASSRAEDQPGIEVVIRRVQLVSLNHLSHCCTPLCVLFADNRPVDFARVDTDPRRLIIVTELPQFRA
jgi:hypothetical protein